MSIMSRLEAKKSKKSFLLAKNSRVELYIT